MAYFQGNVCVLIFDGRRTGRLGKLYSNYLVTKFRNVRTAIAFITFNIAAEKIKKRPIDILVWE